MTEVCTRDGYLNRVYVDPEQAAFLDVKYDNNERGCFVHRERMDYTFAVYPLSLLTINRVADTCISRRKAHSGLPHGQESMRFVKDLKYIRSV